MIAGQSVGTWVLDIVLGLACIGLGSVAIGAMAPRWPTRWLLRDRGPLRLLASDTPDRYRRLGARRLTRMFPELGTVFGGVSKGIAPDLGDPLSIRAYLIEVRRAEWVHWLSMLTWLPLPAFQPFWLAALFLVIVVTVNGAAQVILRYNKVRMSLLLDALGD